LAADVARQEPSRGEQQGDEAEEDPETEMDGPRRVLRERTAEEQSRRKAEGLGGGSDRCGPLRLSLGTELHHRGRRRSGGKADAYARQGATGEEPQYLRRDSKQECTDE
jgi:hypothetical protein